MERNIVVAQIGCGYWGPNVLRSFSGLNGCTVKWIVETSAARRAYVEKQFPKTKAVAEIQAVLDDPHVDAILVATPAGTHYEIARMSLEAGKHVFVEKPLATSVPEAEELKRLAVFKNKVLMVGHTFLYSGAVRHLKSLVEQGVLGHLYYISSERLNLGQVRSDVNVWWNLAPHDVSILLYLMGGEMPVTVSAMGMDYLQPGIEDVAFFSLAWDRGTVAHINVSWLAPEKVRKTTLVGSKKMVIYDDTRTDKIALFNKGVDKAPLAGQRMDYDQSSRFELRYRNGDILLPHVETREPLIVEAEHFLDCIRRGCPALTGPDHGIDVVRILEAGQRALKTRETVSIASPSRAKAA